jgi:hypothetical protein
MIRYASIRHAMTGTPRRRLVTAGTATVVLIGALIVVGRYEVYPRTRVPVESGEAWVASEQIGALTLLDGVADRAVANVTVALDGGDPLAAAQEETSAYALDGRTGDLVRVDGVTLGASRTPVAGPESRMFVGSPMIYLVDAATDAITAYDATDLAPIGPVTTFAPAGDAYAAVVDGTDRLWLIDLATGALSRYDGTTLYHGPHRFPAGSTLTVASGTPVVVDDGSGRAYPLDGSGAARGPILFGLDTGSGDTVVGAGGDLLLTSVTQQAYETCPLSARTCGRAVTLDMPGSDSLGSAVSAYGEAFVPDYTAGTAWLVDPFAGRLPQSIPLLSPGTRFDLFDRNGVLFFNDPRSNRAGTIDRDGTVHAIVKYSVTAPSTAPTPSAGPRPSATPHTSSSPTGTSTAPTGTGTHTATTQPTGTPTTSAPGPTGPAGLACGQTITANTTLTTNLTCSGAGVVIGAAHVTLNLNGHTVTGHSGAGITVRKPYATVNGGTVTGFPIGVSVATGAGHLTVRNVSIRASTTGIDLGNRKIDSLDVEHVVISTPKTGTTFNADGNGFTGHLTVNRSTFTAGNFVLSEKAVALTSTFDHDIFNDNELDLEYLDDTTVSNGTFVNSFIQDMCSGAPGDGNVFQGNVFSGPAYGMEISGMVNDDIEANRFNNTVWGIRFDVGADGDDSGTGTAQISGNQFTGDALYGIWVNDFGIPGQHVSVSGNTLSNNGVDGSGGDDGGQNPVRGGIHIWAPKGGVTVNDNHTSGDSGDGIWSNDGGATGSGNTAPDGCVPAAVLCG